MLYVKNYLILFCLIVFRVASIADIDVYTNIAGGKDDKYFKNIRTIAIKRFECKDSVIEEVVRNSIIGKIIEEGFEITDNENDADIVLEGIITLNNSTNERKRKFSVLFRIFEFTKEDKSIGSYVSGITVKFIDKNKISAYLSISQNISSNIYPEAPEIIGKNIGEYIVDILHGERCDTDTLLYND